jgi:hypothetical protein
MKTNGGVEVELYVFLASALDGSEWLSSFMSQYPLTEDWVDPRTSLNAALVRNWNLVIQLIAIHYWQSYTGSTSE